jgi:hypothetical protein
MPLSDFTLPLRFDPYPDESAMGYCLRVLSRNGATLHALRRLLRMPEKVQLTRSHASVLANLLQVPAQWLEHGLPERSFLRRQTSVCYGLTVYMPNHLRHSHPQVCPYCVHRYGYCRSSWDLSMSTVCLEHGCSLVDICARCSKPLRWDRRSVDVGTCGHFIEATHTNVLGELNPQLLTFQALLDARFIGGTVNMSAGRDGLAGLMNSLSLGGICLLIAAFGTLDAPHQALHSREMTKNFSTNQRQKMILKAFERIEHFDAAKPFSEAESSVVAQSILIRLLEAHWNSLDHRIGIELLKQIFDLNPSRDLINRYPHLGQQSLL